MKPLTLLGIGLGLILMTKAKKVMAQNIQVKLEGETYQQKLINLALSEVKEWKGKVETDWPERIAAYWEAARVPFKDVETPWSAAFIVWLANSVEPGSLPRTGSHVNYAYLSKVSGKGKFEALPPGTEPEPGDIVVFNRGGSTHTFESLDSTPYGISHGDVVVSNDGRTVGLVGGNKGTKGSVLKVEKPLEDVLSDYFVLLRYRGS